MSQLRIDYKRPGQHHHVSQKYVGIDCPWCSPGAASYKLGIRRDGRFATCWTCGSKPVSEALARASGRSYQEVRGLLGELDRQYGPAVPLRGRLVLPDGLEPLGPPHRRYLRQRGFDPERLERLWGLQGIGIAPELAWRVFIPAVWEGRTVSWTTRSIGDENPRRYLSARPEQEALSIKEILLGGDYVRHAVIVCEGPFDAMRIGPGAVSITGLVISPAQKAWLSRIPVRVVCLDAEPAAQRRAEQLCRDLALFEGRTENVVLDAKDPGSATEREIQQLRRLFLD